MTDLAFATADLERLLEEHRRDLVGFCYRMLGSVHEAEDAVQETSTRAWMGLAKVEGTALRSWVYGIATHVCLDMLRATKRRAMPMDLVASSPGSARIGVALPETTWVQPIPSDPAELAVSRETIRLAFVAALQHLPPRQRAVLILRDVLRWRATEVADLLDATVVSVNSALQRARSTLASRHTSTEPDDDEKQALLARYVEAFERFDIDALVALLRDDAIFSMPPFDLWLQGHAAITEWLNGAVDCRASRLVRIDANGSPAFGVYRSGEAFGVQVLELSREGIASIHTFLDPDLFPLFGLPLSQ